MLGGGEVSSYAGEVRVESRTVELRAASGQVLVVWGVDAIGLSIQRAAAGRGVARVHLHTRYGEVTLSSDGAGRWLLGGDVLALRDFGLHQEIGVTLLGWEVVA